MKTYEAAGYLTVFSFSSTFLANSILIYLTIFHIKLITGPYKWMIVIFAFIGIIFSFEEITVRPCIHNFNGAFMFFSLKGTIPKAILPLGTACFGGFISIILAFVAMQFLFRYWTLSNSPFINTFRGFRALIWVVFVLTPSVFYVTVTFLLVSPNDFSDSYMEGEFLGVYDYPLREASRFIVMAYNKDGSLCWKGVGFVISTAGIITASFIIIIYSAVRMRREMRTALNQMSARKRTLETQFFKALMVQTAFPTFLLVLPTGPVIFLPFLDLKVSIQSGFLFALFGLYPPMDSIAMMMIISEYKTCMKNILCCRRNPNAIAHLENTAEITNSDRGRSTAGSRAVL